MEIVFEGGGGGGGGEGGGDETKRSDKTLLLVSKFCALVDYVKLHQEKKGIVLQWKCILLEQYRPCLLVLFQQTSLQIVSFSYLDETNVVSESIVCSRLLTYNVALNELKRLQSTLGKRGEVGIDQLETGEDSLLRVTRRRISKGNNEKEEPSEEDRLSQLILFSNTLTRHISHLSPLPCHDPLPLAPFPEAELNFLVSCYLQSVLPESEEVSGLVKLMEKSSLLPQRADWKGNRHSLSFDELHERNKTADPSTLPHLVGLLLSHPSPNSSSSSSSSSTSSSSSSSSSPSSFSPSSSSSSTISTISPSTSSTQTPTSLPTTHSPSSSTPNPFFQKKKQQQTHSSLFSYVDSMRRIEGPRQRRQRMLSSHHHPATTICDSVQKRVVQGRGGRERLGHKIGKMFDHAFSVRGHCQPVYCLAFDQTCSRLISASDDRLIKVSFSLTFLFIN